MGKIKWTERASDHLRDIFDFISKDSKIYAARYVKMLVHATAKLESMPRCGRIVPELDDSRFSEVIFGNYRIVYRIVGADNDIARICVICGSSSDLLPSRNGTRIERMNTDPAARNLKT